MSSRARNIGACLGAALLSLSPIAAGELITREFNIVAESPRQALVDFGLQADVTISTEGAEKCGKNSHSVVGRMPPPQALKRVLAGTRCRFVQIDVDTFRLVVDAKNAGVLDAEEIVVTATRRRLSIDKAPYSISTVSGQFLSESRSSSILDIASQIAGLTVTNIGAGRNKILIRGLSDGAFSGRTQSTVALYLDDAPLTYNAPDPDLRLTDIDRIEVLRGPQGTLYGADTLGGIVHLVTNKPDPSGVHIAFDGTGASTTGGNPSLSFDGMINVPLIGSKLALRVVGYHEIDGGYIDDVRLGLSNINKVTRDGERYSLLWNIADKWTLTAGAAAQSISADDTQYVQAGFPALQRANNVQEPHTNNFHQSYATLQGVIGDTQLTVSVTHLNHELRDRYDASDEAGSFALAPQTLSYDESLGNQAIVVDSLLQSTGSGRLQWLAGAFFSHADETYLSALHARSASSDTYREHRVDHVIEAALYGEATYRFSSNWSVTTGLRASRSQLDTRSVVDPTSVTTRDFSGEATLMNVTPKFVLSDQIFPSLLIYSQAAKGYRPGGFNSAGPEGQLFSNSGSGPQPDRRFTPDQLWSYELGMKLALADDTVHVRTAAFYSTWSNIQTDQFLPSGLPFTSNVGNGDNSGFEFELDWALSPDLTILANGLIDDPEITARNPNAPAQEDAGLPGVPKVGGGVALRYRRRIARDVTITADLNYAYVGPSHLTFIRSSSTRMGAYSTGAMSLGINYQNAGLSFFVDNPFNVRGNTFAFGNPFTVSRDAIPLRPRTIGVRLSWTYK